MKALITVVAFQVYGFMYYRSLKRSIKLPSMIYMAVLGIIGAGLVVSLGDIGGYLTIGAPITELLVKFLGMPLPTSP